LKTHSSPIWGAKKKKKTHSAVMTALSGRPTPIPIPTKKRHARIGAAVDMEPPNFVEHRTAPRVEPRVKPMTHSMPWYLVQIHLSAKYRSTCCVMRELAMASELVVVSCQLE
jgi:hypothetical protein